MQQEQINIIELHQSQHHREAIKVEFWGGLAYEGWMTPDHYFAMLEKSRANKAIELELHFEDGSERAVAVAIEPSTWTHSATSPQAETARIYTDLLREYSS